MNFQPYVLQDTVNESDDVRTFRFAKGDGTLPAYKPGHFFLLRLKGEDGKMMQRSYSVASHPEEPFLSFCIKLKGAFTHLLWKLKSGDTVEIDGPYGIFLLRQEDTERVFIGGGVGISALRSMILQTVKHDGKRACLFHCAHEFPGLAYFQEMKSLSAGNPLFKFYPSITGEEKPAGWNGMCDRIGVPLLKKILGTFEDKTFYLCGSKGMVSGLTEALIADGVPKDRIKKDEWG
ncbi:Sulfhydrogenase 1 subunit gamma [uncultured archaeon]|nr:Sulfhydrogenase 1 subunit gamma [uncultured archaeon]